MFTRIRVSLLIVLALGFSLPAHADPIVVTFTSSGSPTAWLLNFGVTNHLATGTHNIYFFGLDIADGTLAGSPPGWHQWNQGAPWTNAPSPGSSSRVYRINWFVDHPDHRGPQLIEAGETQDGFLVHLTTTALPASVHWFAWAVSEIGTADRYTGSDAWHTNTWNPGFEGVAVPSANPIPEPTTLALIGTGLLIGALRKRGPRNRHL